MKIGLVVNPWAGIGGSVALKGSDGAATRLEAIARGAKPKANDKALLALQSFLEHQQTGNAHQWYCAEQAMGENVLQQAGIAPVDVLKLMRENPKFTEAQDTETLVQWFLDQGVDLILFAGGDGTARDICRINQLNIPVLGIPAGVKIHSGVFAVTPHAAGEVLAGLVDGRITQLRNEEVRDIDEQAFRDNQVRSKYFGEMQIPVAGEFMQHVKVGGIECDDLVLNDIAEWLKSQLDPQICYFFGSGKTTATVMDYLQLESTLLGVDAVFNGKVIQADCTEQDLTQLLSQYDCQAIISIIGGQGHIFGRGNAQFSAAVIQQLGKDNIRLVGSKNKLQSLQGRPLLVDTSERELDQLFAGLMPVIVGYDETLIYPVAAL